MKKFSVVFVLFLLLLASFSASADTLINQRSYKEHDADVAYNSINDEYLVVWMESYLNNHRVVGKRVDKLGVAGTDFVVSETDVAEGLPSVAYNSQRNEYLVAFLSSKDPDLSIYGQRLSAVGERIGSAPLLMPNANMPTVLYNSLAGNYLVIGERKVATSTDDYCDIFLYSRKVGSDGQPIDALQTICKVDGTPCYRTIEYSIAYAPVVSPETPQGRYLISKVTPGFLTMLDSDGKAMITLTNTQSGQLYYNIPFQQSKIGSSEGWDLAFGYWDNEPVFLLVWADKDTDMRWQDMVWTGIWCGVIDAEKIDYLTTDGVSNETFPISKIWAHWSHSTYSETWNPVVAYNSFAKKFMVTWRETPGPEPENDTNVNHIRGNSMEYDDLVSLGYPPDNIILSAVTGNENPYNPAIATSSREPKALVVWEDNRNFSTHDLDIYGNILETTASFPSTPAFTGVPEFDSQWLPIAPGEEKQIFHIAGGNINDYVIYLVGMDSEGKMERYCYGGCDVVDDRHGFYWYGLTESSITVKLRDEDPVTKKIRVQIWRDAHPDFDSGWQILFPGDTGPLAHNLGGDVDDYIVDLEFADWPGHPPHQMFYGGIAFGYKTYDGNVEGQEWGAYWHSLTNNTVNVARLPDDQKALLSRGRIWKKPNPKGDSGWVGMVAGQTKTFTFPTDINNTFIYYEQNSSVGGINHGYYGGFHDSDMQGSYWLDANDTKINATRNPDDTVAEQVRFRLYGDGAEQKNSTILPAIIMYLLD